MSLAETAAKAKAYGMSYGEYYMRVEMGTLPSQPKYEVEPSAPEVRYCGTSGLIKWTPELTAHVWSMYTSGVKPEEISKRTGIPVNKVRSKLGEIKRNE